MQGHLAYTAQWSPDACGALAQLCRVARALAPHMPGASDAQRSALQQLLSQLPSDNAHVVLPALRAVQQAAQQALQALARQPEAAGAAADPADPAEVRALALRRAHALAMRRGCGNPRCAGLAGASEAEARGKRCTGCRLVRFCSTACSRADWKWHKTACRALREGAAE